MITLNQLKKIITNFFNSHKQVRHFFYGDADKYAGIANKDFVSVNCEYLSSTLSGKALNHSYRISIADILDPNNPNLEDEIVSDAVLIANDFFSFVDNIEDVVFAKSSSLQPFNDENRDRTAGIVFTVILQVQRKANNCITPIDRPTTTTTTSTTLRPPDVKLIFNIDKDVAEIQEAMLGFDDI